jgi:hypothetical protein
MIIGSDGKMFARKKSNWLLRAFPSRFWNLVCQWRATPGLAGVFLARRCSPNLGTGTHISGYGVNQDLTKNFTERQTIFRISSHVPKRVSAVPIRSKPHAL